jgi:uncharacterized ferritin-like protein (DUF455 family)
MELRTAALRALELHDPTQKVAAVQALDFATGSVDTQARLQPQQALPGRPARPSLVHPTTLPKRSAHTVAGRAALLHAVAHIEFNAIKIVFNECRRSPQTMKDEGSDGALHAYGDLRARAESNARVFGHSFAGNELIAV